MLAIRSATSADAEAIARVHVESWRSTYRGIVPDAYLAALDEAERAAMWRAAAGGSLGSQVHLLVAENEEEIVGFACAGPLREPIENHAGEYDAELYAIYLLHEAQGQGTGAAMLTALATVLVTGGFKSMAVWVLAANGSARFYERTGAAHLAEKQTEIGGADLIAVAYGWPSLQALTGDSADK